MQHNYIGVDFTKQKQLILPNPFSWAANANCLHLASRFNLVVALQTCGDAEVKCGEMVIR